MASVSLLPLLFLLAGQLGCASPDYGLNKADDASGSDLDWIELTDSTTVQVSFDAAFQRTNFSQEVGRCQVQMAFMLEYEDDGMGSDTEDENRPEGDVERRPEGPQPTGELPDAGERLTVVHGRHGAELMLPQDPGDCVLSIFDYDGTYEDQDDEHRGEDEEENHAGDGRGGDPNEPMEEGPSNGAWMVRGSIDLGPEVLLAGSADDVWLDRTEDAEGSVFYELLDCDEDTFPFAQTFDLVVPETDAEEGPDGFSMDAAFATAPELQLIRPGKELTDQGILIHSQGKHLSVAWEIYGEAPEVLGEPLEQEMMIWLQTIRQEDRRYEEALACMPFTDVDHFLIPRDWFHLMKANEPGTDDPVYESSLQVDLKTHLLPVTIGTVELGRMSSTTTDGGIVLIEESTR